MNFDVDKSEPSYSETEGKEDGVEADVDVDLSERCDGQCRCRLTCGAETERSDLCEGLRKLEERRRQGG